MSNNEVKSEIINNGTPSGPISEALMDSYDGIAFNMNKFRSLTSLPERAWKYFDDVLITVAKRELVGIADLARRAETNVSFDGMTASVYLRDSISEMDDANISMTPDTRGEAGRLEFKSIGVPLAVTYKDFLVNTKQIASAARVGIPLRAQLVEEATRAVSRTLEELLFNGEYKGAGSTVYGYTKYPYRQIYTIPLSWTDPTCYPDKILADVNNMISMEFEANHLGPWILYIPWAYQVRLNQDYTVGGAAANPVNGSIQARLLQLPGLEAIRVSKNLADDNIVLVEMSSSTVQLITGLPLTVADWEPAGSPNWQHLFKVLTISVPFLVSDYDDNCGIVHGSI